METEKIIALIAEDIKHNQLLNGLDSIGLWDNDRYTLELDIFIADLMGYKRGKILGSTFTTKPCFPFLTISHLKKLNHGQESFTKS